MKFTNTDTQRNHQCTRMNSNLYIHVHVALRVHTYTHTLCILFLFHVVVLPGLVVIIMFPGLVIIIMVLATFTAAAAAAAARLAVALALTPALALVPTLALENSFIHSARVCPLSPGVLQQLLGRHAAVMTCVHLNKAYKMTEGKQIQGSWSRQRVQHQSYLGQYSNP